MKKIALTTISLIILLFISCTDDDNKVDPVADVSLDNEINDFVWKGLNKHYYWQEDVPNLADAKKDNINAFNTYLNGESEPKDLFTSLLYKYVGTVGKENAVDRFSWFIEDYEEQNASFRGVNDAFGFEFSLARVSDDSNEVIGYITYVVPNSPASDAGLKRADIFNVFDGVSLTLDNYKIVNNYYSKNSISMKFATINNGNIVSNGKEASLNLREVTENPVHYASVINIGSKKVGYLVYNGFKYTFHDELNAIFGDFKSAGIQELVLDLRYNGGGSVLTSAYLASMIHAGASTDDVFGKLIYNSKNSTENGAYPFFNNARIYDKEGEYTGSDASINRLSSLSRLYVITSDNTASASEMIINGLSPYMTVIKVGTTTYGKNVGSFTVYDSPDFGATNVNPNHKNAMQPITFKIFNKLDQSDYTKGFEPDYEQVEYISDMKPFGDLQEPLLKVALNHIAGITPKLQNVKELELQTEQIFSSFDRKPFSKEMYQISNE